MSEPATAPSPRRRFYRRRGFWFGSGLGLFGLLLLLALAGYWLLQTVAGRDLLLAQVLARLPAGASVQWGAVEGPLAGPLTLRDVRFDYQDLHVRAGRVHLDPSLRPLLGRTLRLDALQLSDASIDVGKSDEPFKLPSWPDSLPQLDLPLALQADRIVIDNLRISQSRQPLIAIAQVRGGIELGPGRLQARQLRVASDRGDFRIDGHYLPGRDYRADLTATAVLPAARGRTPARLGLVARGDLGKMQVAVAGRAPEPLRATLTLSGRKRPEWNFDAASEALDLSRLLPPAAGGGESASTPLAFALQARGHGGQAQLQGKLRQGAWQATLQPSQIALNDQVLDVRSLVIDAFDGRTRLQGSADLRDPDDARFRFAVVADGLRFLPTADPTTPDVAPVPVELTQARLGVAGRLRAWAAVGRVELARQAQQASLQLDVRGDQQHADLRQLRASTPGGNLEVSGRLGWQPQLDWDLAATLAKFDPGYFVPGWDGALSGTIDSKGRQRPLAAADSAAGYDLQARISALRGQLRQRALAAEAHFTLHGQQGQGDLALQLGHSRLSARGTVGDRLDVQAQLQPLQLDDLLPGASGSLRGNVQVGGRLDAPDLVADLEGSALSWDGYGAEQLRLHGRLPWRGQGGALTLQGRTISAGTALDTLRVQARGAVENLAVDADLGSALATLALRGEVRRDGARWQGQLAGLDIAPAKGAAWALRQPARFSLAGSAFSLSESCLAAVGGGALCVQADWPRSGVAVNAQALPLTLLQPWLPKQQGRPITLRGEVALEGRLRPRGHAWEGDFQLSSREGGVRLGEPRFSVDLGGGGRGELIRYDQFSIKANFDPSHINAYFGVGFQGAGFVDARFDTGWDAYAPLQGELYLNMSRLYWLQLFVADIDRPQGLVEGHVSLRGTRSQPLLGGEATLANFTAEYPAMGLSISEGQGRFEALPDGSAKITSSARSGEGTLRVEGGLSWYGQATPLQLHIHGTNVLAYNTSELHVIANPDLQFGLVDQTMQLRGRVEVPEAKIDLERLDRGTSASEDVVVVDPVDPEQTPASPLDMELALVLGDKVQINGFGLKGGLSGQLQVRAKPGHEMTGEGNLDVSGRYKAYGQDLTISRGQLSWSNNVVSDPRINIRAERKIGDVTAGIDVSGRAESPRADVWSNPAMSQSEALSYLVLGRSLSTASSDETEQVTAASAALSAGSGLIASQLGAKLGLDDAGVQQSSTLGGSVLGVGKYLSPKLYVGYGVSMVGAGSVLTLKYLLSRGFDVEVESSTVETRSSLNWRKEK